MRIAMQRLGARRAACAAALVAGLAACADERGPRAAGDAVSFSGWIYPDASSIENGTPLTTGSVVFFPEGEDPVAADQPYADYPGYWSVELEPAVPLTIRVEAEDAYPAVWAADAPSTDGTWLAGTLFGADRDWIDATFAEIAEAAGVELPALTDTTIHAWGAPYDGTAWDCATLTVAGVRPLCLAMDDDGASVFVESGPFDSFFAFGVPAGDVVVEAPGLREVYPTVGGDVVHAFWLVPATEEER